jgi:heat shock protein HslJ
MIMGSDGKVNRQRPNYRLIIFIIFVGLCSLFIAETIRTTGKTIDRLKYHAPLPSKLSGETVWEVDYVLIAGQHKSPDILFASEMIPPQIKFGPLHDYKGNDGCNDFHGLFLDDGKGNITLSPAEETRVACVDDNRSPPLLHMSFLEMLEKSVRYELVPNQLRLYLPNSSDSIVFHPRSATSEMLDLDYFHIPMFRWECQGLPYIIIRYLGQRCVIF